jgi:hypothetical protein
VTAALLLAALLQGQHPPVASPAPPEATAINKDLLRHVEDDAPPRSEAENRDEFLAYDYAVQFARRVPAESFRKAARHDLTFAHLMGSDAPRFRGEVVHVEGRLKRLRDIGPTTALRAEGIEHLYEGWIFSDLYAGYAYCVLFTELPADLAVAESLDRRVSFDGYFYKVYRYRAGDGVRRSPLLIGRTIKMPPVAEGPTPLSSEGGRSLQLIGVVTLVSLALLALIALGFRWADRRIRQRIAAARRTPDQNPFE